MDNTSLTERAARHARYLAQTIGSRPAGSSAEKQAFDYIIHHLQNWGYHVERLPAPYAPSPAVHYPYLVGVLALAGSGLAISRFPWLVLGLPFLIAALPQWTIWAARKRKPCAQSENVFASVQPFVSPSGSNSGEEKNKDGVDMPYSSLILVAHVDSARALPFRSRFWLRLYSRTMDIIQRIAVMLSFLGVLHGVGFILPIGLLAAGKTLAVLTAAVWLFMQLWGIWRVDYSPGAVDNASGVGVLLALAENFAGHMPEALRLGFLFTGAEETGAHGSEAFADQLREKGVQTAVINIDLAGAGDTLRYITSEGVYFPLRTDPQLNQMVRKVFPRALPLNETLRSGDHAPFIRRGFPTAALQTRGSPQAEQAYHTIHDTVELLDPQSMEMTIQCIIDLCTLQGG